LIDRPSIRLRNADTAERDAPDNPPMHDHDGHGHSHGDDGGEHGGHGHSHGGGDDGKPRIGFVGAGRVGTVLGEAFARAGWDVTSVASRSEEQRKRFASRVPGARTWEEPAAVLDDADLIFLTIPDDTIAGMAESLHLYSGQAVVHTSGALPASVLEPAMAAGTSSGSFHPLVAFADIDQALADLAGATVAIEGEDSLMPLLADLAESIGARPVTLPEGGKTAYHAAAMMAAGGLVGLLDAIASVARLAGLDERAAMAVYAPLARQALANAEKLGIDAALTGPLLRGDVGTLRGHLQVMGAQAPDAIPLYVEAARREVAIAVRRGDLPADRATDIEELLASATKSAAKAPG
jgi:predicted short-subunit dehydrogenase-like oxidoreductase (DUF2520 family)